MSRRLFNNQSMVKYQVSMKQVLEHYGLLAKMQIRDHIITGACPIHEGRNESVFSVNINENRWRCISHCGCGGDVIDFVSKKEKVSKSMAQALLIRWFAVNAKRC